MAKPIIIKARSSLWHFDFPEMIQYRWVFFMLLLRDIKLRYRQTALGVLWVFLQPVITAALFAAVFSKVMHVSSEGIPYIAFAFCGLIPWVVFSSALQRAGTSLVNESNLITKVYFPRIFIPLSATFGLAIDYIITIVVMAGIMAIWKVPPGTNLLFLPLATLLLFFFSTGINIVFATCNVYYRDFKHMLPFLTQFWMYASPIAYSAEMVPERFSLIYHLNPLVGIIDLFRYTFLPMESFPLFSVSVSAVTTLIICLFGGLYFRKLEHTFADII